MIASHKVILQEFMLIDNPADDSIVERLESRFGIKPICSFSFEAVWQRPPELSAQELTQIIKILSKLEFALPNFLILHYSLQELILRLNKLDSDAAHELLVWIFLNSAKSKYVPPKFKRDEELLDCLKHIYGTASNLYFDTELGYFRASAIQTQQRNKVAKKRKEQRTTKHIAFTAKQIESREERRLLLDSLAHMNPLQRLQVIVDDDKHRPFFYPEEFADLDLVELRDLSQAIREKLVVKLSYAPKGKWRNLHHLLTTQRNTPHE